MRAREMEISESSVNNYKQNPDTKPEGDVLEARRTRGASRRSNRRVSVFDLEAEETKGFIDLGFVFTEEDLNSELSEILPGLRTFLHREEQSKKDSSVPRPYLSEAWEFHSDKWSGRSEKVSMDIDLRMAKLCGDRYMKDSLKWWARSVASNLK
ncbi:unnamed protein product [Eruca vesicaria subsp. sativa]|uniref:Uncharacterized protein n=1 Tax=Eruca vesicaria subsp. sativa TaxID=29727 RepID=A0ABC8KAN1_ERUVS|nr:unnamed protein product [Eruca vesicaria subsp. sativa]